MIAMWKLTLGLMAIGGFALSACGVPVDGSPRAIVLDSENFDPTSASVQLVEQSPQEPAGSSFPATSQGRATLFFDRGLNDETLEAISRSLPQAPTPEATLELLLAGPTQNESLDGYRTYLPLYDEVVRTELDGDNFVIEFVSDTSLKDLSGRQIYLAIGQITLTLTESTDVVSIGITIGGVAQELPTDRGNVQRSVTAEDYSQLLSLRFPVDELNSFFLESPPAQSEPTEAEADEGPTLLPPLDVEGIGEAPPFGIENNILVPLLTEESEE